MNIFKSFTFTWWQSWLLKITMLSAGIILGVYLHDFFLKWIAVVAILCVVPGIAIIRIWWKQQPPEE